MSKVFHLHQRDHHHLQVVVLHNTMEMQIVDNIQNLEKVQKEEVVDVHHPIQIQLQLQVVQDIHNLEKVHREVDNHHQIVSQVRVVVFPKVMVLQLFDYNSLAVYLS
jgi:hypothetical protein